jgi:16S rRNA (cytosine1402-N4)-methyltransferase
MPKETLEFLRPSPGGVYVDATLGGGGHAARICAQVKDGLVIGLDRDPAALARAQEVLQPFGKMCRLCHAPFSKMKEVLQEMNVVCVQGILMDLGFSSDQIEDPARGFSFMEDGPLDMRMNPNDPFTAADLLNTWSERDLRDCFWRLGEEREGSRIARMVVTRRETQPWERTLDLASAIEQLNPRRGRRTHPATKVFQALRIMVNRELDELDEGLLQAAELLEPGGRLAVISFHSLEDRTVKNFFKLHSSKWENLQEGGSKQVGQLPLGQIVTRRAVKAGEDEQRENPRSRSACLRVWEKVAA